jgi:hypothetical protein
MSHLQSLLSISTCAGALRVPDTATGDLTVSAGAEGCSLASVGASRDPVHDQYDAAMAQYWTGDGARWGGAGWQLAVSNPS